MRTSSPLKWTPPKSHNRPMAPPPKAFDWSKCTHSLRMTAFLKSVQHSGISEAEFIESYTQIPYVGSGHPAKARTSSTARSEYRRLKNDFDFFAPKQ